VCEQLAYTMDSMGVSLAFCQVQFICPSKIEALSDVFAVS